MYGVHGPGYLSLVLTQHVLLDGVVMMQRTSRWSVSTSWFKAQALEVFTCTLGWKKVKHCK